MTRRQAKLFRSDGNGDSKCRAAIFYEYSRIVCCSFYSWMVGTSFKKAGVYSGNGDFLLGVNVLRCERRTGYELGVGIEFRVRQQGIVDWQGERDEFGRS